MIIARNMVYNTFRIRQPRYHDRVVLLANYKISTHNRVIFTHDKNLEGEFYISGIKAREYDLASNGKLLCRQVPLEELEPFEYEENIALKAKSLF
mgnify:CR=1 FL=1